MQPKQNRFLFLCALLLCCVLTAQTREETNALKDLYHSTAGEGWTHSWNLDRPVSEWHGVTLRNGHVVALDLSENNLDGELPSSIAQLRELVSLNLSDNKLVGSLPASLADFKNLGILDVSRNKLKGKIPRGIARLLRLRSLQLAGNDFKDYSGLKHIGKHQLVAFDMATDFADLELIDFDAWSGMADTGFED